MQYLNLKEKYRAWLQEHGDTPQGVGWTKPEEAPVRYRVMMEVIREWPASILDFGCGTAALLDHIKALGLTAVDYYGLDILPEAIEMARTKHPEAKLFCADILKDDAVLDSCPVDYVTINGVLTYKYTSSFDDMWGFAQAIISRLFKKARKGLAANFMSKAVDWERDDLFHMPVELIANFVTRNLTKYYVIRHDYKRYEYTLYLYHEPGGSEESHSGSP